MNGGLRNELQQFIDKYIVSIEKLEILLLLAESPQKNWTADEVFQKIQSSRASVVRRLRELQTEGFAVRHDDGAHQFSPKSTELAALTAELNSAYRERRIKVIEAIFSKSNDQIRRFSDAFRFKKDDE